MTVLAQTSTTVGKLIDGVDGLQGPKGDQGIPGVSSYTHIAYATNATGTTGFDLSDPTNKTYIGMFVDTNEDDSTNPADYKWSLIKGADGAQGTPGPTGADGKTSYFHTAYATNATGTTGFSTTDATNKLYMGTYTDFVKSDSTNPADYTWALIKGADGIPGTSSYTHIAYATNATGTTGFDVSDSTNKTYIGMYVDSVSTDSTDPTKYKWSLIKGADGAQGVQGPTGADGKTSYFHTAYATNATGTTGFSTTDPVNKTYLGTYTDFVSADSTTASDYTWSLIKGADGAQGTPGTSSYTHLAYATNATGTAGFSTTVSANKTYIGMYVDSVSTDSADPTKYKWTLIKGADGSQGVQGPAGADGISSYLHIAYATNATGTAGFDLSDPTDKTYIGQYTDTVSSDSTDPTKYTWMLVRGADGIQGLQGPAGDQGIPGPKGADGTSSYTHLAYATNATGTTGFSTSVSTGKTYIGMYVDSTATDSTDPTKYKWTLIKGADGSQGTPGPAGANGVSSYLHIAYATNATGTTGFSTTDSAGKTYIGQYTDTTSADSTDYTKYSWTLIKGDQGPQGDQGDQGIPGVSSYTHIAYATNATGTAGFSITDPVGATYIGMFVDTNEDDSTNPADYKWSLIKGADGAQGIQGPTGADGKTSYFHTAYATNATGTTGFSTTDATGKTYLGTYTDFTSADSTTASDYTWSLIKGADGAQGIPGTSSYTHIAYATNATGTTGFDVSVATGKTYIGMYVDSVSTDSTDPTKYTWSLIKGADGAQGVQGPTGADGKTSYFHTAYATNATGTTGFSTTDSTGKTYLGTYTDFTSSDSTTASDYTWSLIKGADGAQGIPGTSVTITSTSIQYAISTSATVTPTSWVNTVPATQLGKYMWTKTSVTYSNGTNTVAYSVALSGVNGADGVNSEIISSDTPPASPTVNSFWNDTSTTPNVLKVYRSGGWVVYQFTADNIASGSITADKIATKAITASKIDMNEVTYQIEDSSKNLLRNTGFQPTSKSGYISDGWSGVFYRNSFGQRNYLTNSEFTPYNSPDWNIILPDTLAKARSTTAGYNGSKGIRIDTNSEADGYAGYSGISQIVPVPVGATMVSMRAMVYATALSSDNGTYLDGDIIAYDKNNKIITTLVPLGTPYAHDVGKWVSSNSRFLNVSIPSGTTSIGFRQYLRGKGIVTFSQPMVVFDTVIGDYVSDAVVDKPNKLNKVVNSEFQAGLVGWSWKTVSDVLGDKASYNTTDSYKDSPAFSYDGSNTSRLNLVSQMFPIPTANQSVSFSLWVKGSGTLGIAGFKVATEAGTGTSYWETTFSSTDWTKIVYTGETLSSGSTGTATFMSLYVWSTHTAFSVAQPMLVFDTTVGNYLKGPMPVIGDYVPGIGRTDNTVNELTNTEFSPDFRGWDITDGLASVTQVPGYNGSNAIRLDASNATADNNTYKYINTSKTGSNSLVYNTVPQVNRNYIVNSSGLNASATTRPSIEGGVSTIVGTPTVTYASDGILLTNSASNTNAEWGYDIATAMTAYASTSLLPGSTYTFSVDVMGTIPQVMIRYGYNDGAQRYNPYFSINNTSYTRISVTLTPSSTAETKFFIRIDGAINNQQNTGFSGGETLKFRNVKLESGSVATPWSLAPEDTMTIPATKPDNSIHVPKGTKTFSLRVMGYIESISSNSSSYVNGNVQAFDDMGVSLGYPLASGALLDKTIIGSWQQNHARALNVTLPDNTAYLEVHMYLRGQGIVRLSQPILTFDSSPGDYVPGAIAGNDISTVNLLPNSEFLPSLGGWYGGRYNTTVGGAYVTGTPISSTSTLSIDNTQSYYGSTVLKNTAPFSWLYSDLVPVVSGNTLYAGIQTYSSTDYSGNVEAAHYLGFYDINKNYISQTALNSGKYSSWTRYIASAVIPANVAYVSHMIGINGSVGSVYYSQPMLYMGNSVLPYEPSLNYPTSRVEIVGDNFDTTNDSNGNTSDRGIAIPASSTSTTILVENWNRTDGVSDYVFGLWAKTTSPVTISVGNISNVLYGTNPITTLGDGYWRNYEMKVNFVGTQGALPITISASPAEVRLARFMLVRRDTALGGAWLAAPEDNLANTQQLTDQITQSFSLGNGQLRSVISNLNSGYTSSFIQDSNGNMQSITQGDTLVSAINLTPDGVYIKGNKIQLDGNVNVTGDFYALGGNFKNINASNITTGTLNASLMTTGTLDASKITVTKLSANSITTGAFNASLITTGTLDASKITVTNLSATSITTGTLDASKITVTNLSANSITTGTINGITITGSTINGGTINASSTINFVVGVNSADMGIYGNSMFSSTYGTSIWSGTGTVSATTGFKLSGTYSYKPDRSEYTTIVNSSTTIANSVIVLADDTTDPRANRLILSSQGMMLANSNTTDYPYFYAGTGGVFAKEYHTYDLRQWTSVSLTSAFSTYNSDSSLALRYYKDPFSKIVYLQGQITPNSTISSGTSVKIGSLITEFGNYTPEIPVVLLQQGTGSNRWLLTVNPNGDITFSRYGNTDYANANAGNWLPITASWPTEIY